MVHSNTDFIYLSGLCHRKGSLIIVGDDTDDADANGHDTDEE
jgi:hypothetical protein